MPDIGEFAEEVAKRSIRAISTFKEAFGASFDLAIDEHAIKGLVKAAYYASMIPDEGRFPALSLMSFRMDGGRQFHFRFQNPLTPTAQEIAKLAQAMNADSHLCIVTDKGQCFLGGIDVTALPDTRHFGYAALRVGNPFKLTIRGPGHIDASCGGHSLIYNAGQIVEEKSLRFGHVLARLAACVKSELKGKTDRTIESLEDVFFDLLLTIATLGHGGLLLVTKNAGTSEFSSLREVDSTLLHELLLGYWKTWPTCLQRSVALRISC